MSIGEEQQGMQLHGFFLNLPLCTSHDSYAYVMIDIFSIVLYISG